MTQTQELLDARIATAWKVYADSEDEDLKTALLVRIEGLKHRADALKNWAHAPASV